MSAESAGGRCHGDEAMNCSTLDNLNNPQENRAHGMRVVDRSQIHRTSVADQVAAVLRQRILNGELRPGTSLQEIPLSHALGVSRNTMREAMRILSLE